MIVLVVSEFGYVTPPVALNHLLTRLSVGDDEVNAADAEAKEKYTSFYYRYERWLLPIIVLFLIIGIGNLCTTNTETIWLVQVI